MPNEFSSSRTMRQFAPYVFLLYFVGGWAMDRGQRKKKDADAYRDDWLNKRDVRGNSAEGNANEP